MTQNQHCNNDNNYNDDNVMRENLSIEIFDGLL